MKREQIIENMCMTWRHDYGLMEEKERQSLFNSMAQIFDNDIAKELITQSDVDDYEERIAKYEEPYDEDIITSDDVGKGKGYLQGHAWVGRVKANTTYRIIVVED